MNLSVESIGCPQNSLSRSFGVQLVNFQEVARTSVHLLMEFLGDSDVVSANDVILFVREIIETNPKLRVSIIVWILDTFYQIRSSCVCSCALWIIGEYCLSFSEVENGLSTINQCLSGSPFYTLAEDAQGLATCGVWSWRLGLDQSFNTGRLTCVLGIYSSEISRHGDIDIYCMCVDL